MIEELAGVPNEKKYLKEYQKKYGKLNWKGKRYVLKCYRETINMTKEQYDEFINTLLQFEDMPDPKPFNLEELLNEPIDEEAGFLDEFADPENDKITLLDKIKLKFEILKREYFTKK